MKNIDELTINLIYLDGRGGRWDCSDMLSANEGELMNKKGIKDFVEAKGGIDLLGGHGELLFSSVGVYNLEACAGFLMFGLSSLGLLPPYLADGWKPFGDEGGLLSELSEVKGRYVELRQGKEEGKLLVLVYGADGEEGPGRDLQEVFSIAEEVWVEASLVVLDRYFHAAKAVRNWYPRDEYSLPNAADSAASWVTFRGG